MLLGRIWQERYLAGDQLRGDPVSFPFDSVGNIAGWQRLLRAEQLIDPSAQQRPIGLRDREMAAEIEEGALAHAGAASFGSHEAMREVAFAVGGGAGLRAAHEHG